MLSDKALTHAGSLSLNYSYKSEASIPSKPITHIAFPPYCSKMYNPYLHYLHSFHFWLSPSLTMMHLRMMFYTMDTHPAARGPYKDPECVISGPRTRLKIQETSPE